MSKETVYLVINDMSGVMSDKVIGMINFRNSQNKRLTNYIPFPNGTNYTELRRKYKEDYYPVKGYGGYRYKEEKQRWCLPFTKADGMPDPDPNYGVILSKSELLSFGWDIEDREK